MSKNLPTVTSSIPRDLRNFVDRLRDIINGKGNDKLLSTQDLVTAGIATVSSSGLLTAAVQEGVVYGPPPAPTNVAATAAIQNVVVTWDSPDYPGHAYAEIWGASTDNIGAAVVLGLAPGAIYTDPLGPSETRYYWVRFVNTQDLAGPYNAVAGTPTTTGDDVDYLLDVLAGQISTSQLTTALNSRLNGIESNATAITNEATTRATADSALSSSISTVSASVNTVSAAVQTETTARVNADSSINAKYTVKIDNGGHISGFGLISDANTASPYAAFGVRANQFFIAPPATVQTTAPTTGLYVGYVWVDSSVSPNVTKYYTGSAWTTTPQALPFVVQASSTTVNGVAVAAGVYMDAAFIKNGTITNAKIGNAAIDNAKISDLAADKITAGSLQTGSYIRSSNYVAGSAGFNIPASGSAEFSTATIRGTVYATDSEFTGTVKAGTTILGGSATNYTTGTGFFAGVVSSTYKWRVGDPAGNRISWDGTTATFNGTLEINSSATGARLVITNTQILVYDASDNIRVKIGAL